MSSLYRAAASAVRAVDTRERAVKGAAFEAASEFSCPVNKLLPLVQRTCERLADLRSAVRAVSLLTEAYSTGRGSLSEYDVLVAVYEDMFGRGIQGGGALKRLVRDSKAELQRLLELALAKSKSAAGPSADAGKQHGQERVVRVNTLRLTVPEAITALTTPHDGAARVSSSSADPVVSSASRPAGGGPSDGSVGYLHPHEVRVDGDVPYLLHLDAPDAHARLRLHAHPLVRSGRLILQDKASALTAHCLMGGLLPSGSYNPAGAVTAPAPTSSASSAVAVGSKRKLKDAAAASSLYGGTDAAAGPASAKRARGSSCTGSTAGSALASALRPPSSDAAAAGSDGVFACGIDWSARLLAIDACAAPGNKTSQLAALLRAAAASASAAELKPCVFAFDKDPARAALLHRRMCEACGWSDKDKASASASKGAIRKATVAAGLSERAVFPVRFAGASIEGHDDEEGDDSAGMRSHVASGAAPLIEVRCTDFLTLHPGLPAGVDHSSAAVSAAAPFASQLSGVQLLLLDPSCSGSGMAAKDASKAAMPGSGTGSESSAAAAIGESAAAVPPLRSDPRLTEEEVRRLYQPPAHAFHGTSAHGDLDAGADVAAGGSGRGSRKDGSSGGGGSGGGGGAGAYAARVASLAAFQRRAMRHAMTAFPAAARVAYSTCSLWLPENEGAVAAALADANAHGLRAALGGAGASGDAAAAAAPSTSADAAGAQLWVRQWRLAEGVLPLWHRRGVATLPAAISDADAGSAAAAVPAGVLLAPSAQAPVSSASAAAPAPASKPLLGLTPSQAACCVRVDPRADAPRLAPRTGRGASVISTTGSASVISTTGSASVISTTGRANHDDDERGMCGFFVAVMERVWARMSRTAAAAELATLEAALAAAAGSSASEAATGSGRPWPGKDGGAGKHKDKPKAKAAGGGGSAAGGAGAHSHSKQPAAPQSAAAPGSASGRPGGHAKPLPSRPIAMSASAFGSLGGKKKRK